MFGNYCVSPYMTRDVNKIGPVVPGKCLLCRITPNHTASGDAFRWFDPFIVIFTLYIQYIGSCVKNSLRHLSTCDWLSWVTWWREQKYAGILFHMQWWWWLMCCSQSEWVKRMVRNRLSLAGWQQFCSNGTARAERRCILRFLKTNLESAASCFTAADEI